MMSAMEHQLRPYDRERDLAAVTRIWREVGWIEDDDDEPPMARFLDAANVEVGLLDDEAECAVCWIGGTIRYQDTDLPLGIVAGVTTSRIARRLGLASTMTARSLRAAADSGAAVAALGMFDQGFYNKIGFGVGAYTNVLRFHPSSLALGHIPYRRPIRLTADDAEEFHALSLRRHRGHGGVTVEPPTMVRSEMEWGSNLIALGYRNDEGRLTHALVGTAKGEHGPYRILFLAYEEPDQLLELLRLLRELGDQVHTVRIDEPPEIQLQDLIERPFDQLRRTAGGPNAAGADAIAWVQLRILDLAPVVAARSWPGPSVTCNLELTDPITAVLAKTDGDTWSGVGGTYRLTIGSTSTIEAVDAIDPDLPTLQASIGAFSRCWFGVRSASSLRLTDELDGPAELLAQLDQALALPPPHPGWDF